MAQFGSKSTAEGNPAPGSAPAAAAAAALTPEQRKKLEEVGQQRAALLGRILALMSISPRHNRLTLREINALLTPAIAHGQFAMIGGPSQDGHPQSLAAVAWWAFVSPEVDKRLSESRNDFLHVERCAEGRHCH